MALDYLINITYKMHLNRLNDFFVKIELKRIKKRLNVVGEHLDSIRKEYKELKREADESMKRLQEYFHLEPGTTPENFYKAPYKRTVFLPSSPNYQPGGSFHILANSEFYNVKTIDEKVNLPVRKSDPVVETKDSEYDVGNIGKYLNDKVKDVLRKKSNL